MQLSKTENSNPLKLDPQCESSHPGDPALCIQQLAEVELIGIEPTTSALQGRRSPS